MTLKYKILNKLMYKNSNVLTKFGHIRPQSPIYAKKVKFSIVVRNSATEGMLKWSQLCGSSCGQSSMDIGQMYHAASKIPC